MNIVFATGTGESEQPDSKTVQQQGDKKPSTEIEPDENFDFGIEDEEIQTVDSTEDDSVSKYNFIFYFLYKMKYNEDQEVEGLY